MGADIWTYTEQCHPDGTWQYHEWDSHAPRRGPFDRRQYTTFGVLAGIREDQHGITPIFPRRGLPDDISPHVQDEWNPELFHTPTWVTVVELVAVDYDQQVPTFDGQRTLRSLVCEDFFVDLHRLKRLDDVLPTRVVFWFDN
jgi:hypothetical protein